MFVISLVFAVEGCPLSGVPLYTKTKQPRLKRRKRAPTIGILCIQPVSCLSCPWQLIITATIGHAIISNSHYLMFWIHDTGTHLGRVRERVEREEWERGMRWGLRRGGKDCDLKIHCEYLE